MILKIIWKFQRIKTRQWTIILRLSENQFNIPDTSHTSFPPNYKPQEDFHPCWLPRTITSLNYNFLNSHFPLTSWRFLRWEKSSGIFSNEIVTNWQSFIKRSKITESKQLTHAVLYNEPHQNQFHTLSHVISPELYTSRELPPLPYLPAGTHDPTTESRASLYNRVPRVVFKSIVQEQREAERMVMARPFFSRGTKEEP